MAGVWGLERVLSLRPQPGSDQCVAVIGRTQEGGGCRVWTSSSDDVEGPRDPPRAADRSPAVPRPAGV